jgi:C1A family cysteine protease
MSITRVLNGIKDDVNLEANKKYAFKKPLLNRVGIIRTKPRDVDWTQYFTPIKDQLETPMCAAFMGASIIESLYKIKFDVNIDLSEQMIYYWAQRNDELEGEDYEGTTIKGVMKALYNDGVCYENEWPFRTDFSKPTKDILKIKKYNLVELELSHLHEALRRKPIAAGFYLPERFESTTDNGIVPNTLPDKASGHAMTIVGYNLKYDLFKVRNSWGEEWGKKGYCFFQARNILRYLRSAFICSI